MSFSISSLTPITPAAGHATSLAAPAAGKTTNFAALLEGAIQGVEQPRRDADQAIQSLLNGDEELHTVALAAQRADLAFDLGLQVRNKIV